MDINDNCIRHENRFIGNRITKSKLIRICFEIAVLNWIDWCGFGFSDGINR
jgi:hypothetical protein